MRKFLNNQKTSTMKKVFALLAIVSFVACNSGETKTAVDSTKTTVDTAKKAVDTAKVAVDSTKKDSTKK